MPDLPRFSVFTPSHDSRFLNECLASLLAQTNSDWEWVVMLNGGAQWMPSVIDERVRIYRTDSALGVGAAKAAACARAEGEILVELDHDDILLPTALASIGRAFEDSPEAALAFSHWAQITADGADDPSRFNPGAGWTYREFSLVDRTAWHAVAMEPTPHNVSYIWFAPNHVRAFVRWAYDAAGGYDDALAVLDDQDLISRLYAVGSFVLIDECLYLQRMHGANTQSRAETNAHIQRETVVLYDRYFPANAVAWARRAGLSCIELGPVASAPSGVDRVEYVDAAGRLAHIDVADDSVGVIFANDAFARVSDKIGMANELYRVLAPGGIVLTATPSSEGRGADANPSYRASYNEQSFWYLTQSELRSTSPGLEARFQSSRLVTTWPSPWHEQNSIPYVYCNLIALKDDTPRNGGPLLS